MHLQEITLFDLDPKVTRNVAQYPRHHVTYAPAKFNFANPMVKEKMHLQYIIWPWPWGQGHTKCCPVPSTSCDLCTSKVWYCYIPGLRRRCIYKKIHYLTMTLGVMVTGNVAQCPLHHVTYAPTEFEVTTSKGLGGEAFTRKFNIWLLTLTMGSRSHKMLPSTLHHVTYSATKFEIATSNRLGGDTFTRKYIIWPLTLTLGLRSNKMLPSTLHHVTYSATKFEIATSNRLGGDTFTRKYIIWPLTLGLRSNKMLPSTLYIMWPIQLQSLKLLRLTVSVSRNAE